MLHQLTFIYHPESCHTSPTDLYLPSWILPHSTNWPLFTILNLATLHQLTVIYHPESCHTHQLTFIYHPESCHTPPTDLYVPSWILPHSTNWPLFTTLKSTTLHQLTFIYHPESCHTPLIDLYLPSWILPHSTNWPLLPPLTLLVQLAHAKVFDSVSPCLGCWFSQPMPKLLVQSAHA